jgi:hypothetical protein
MGKLSGWEDHQPVELHRARGGGKGWLVIAMSEAKTQSRLYKLAQDRWEIEVRVADVPNHLIYYLSCEKNDF